MGYPVLKTFSTNSNTGDFKNLGTETGARGMRSMTFTLGSIVDLVVIPPGGTNTVAGADAERVAENYIQIRSATNTAVPPVLPPMDIERCWVRANGGSGVAMSVLAWGG
jgi:hypothetical protein